jgi:hypothetical protein
MRRRALQIGGVLVVAALVVIFAPGIDAGRNDLARASVAWLLVGVGFEALSCLSYGLMFRPIFCPRMPRKTGVRLSLSEVGVGSLVPAAGAGGLALGAWALNRIGMDTKKIATRSVAFFIIKSSVNFLAALVIALLLAVGLAGPSLDLALTLGPAVLAIIAIVAVCSVPLVLSRTSVGAAPDDAPRWRSEGARPRRPGGGVDPAQARPARRRRLVRLLGLRQRGAVGDVHVLGSVRAGQRRVRRPAQGPRRVRGRLRGRLNAAAPETRDRALKAPTMGRLPITTALADERPGGACTWPQKRRSLSRGRSPRLSRT